jgi:HEPN domain-containing protein
MVFFTKMVNIEEQIRYWERGSDEDYEVAGQLIGMGRTRHGLFFAHLAIEKKLKAVLCLRTQRLAPRIHNLIRLSEFCDLALSDDQLEFLAEMNEYNIEGRYPFPSLETVSKEEANLSLRKVKEILQWLAQQLHKA